MDTHRLTDPIGGHLAGAATLAAAVADATTGIADTIVDRVGDLDFAGTAERTRRSLMRRVGRDHRSGSRRWALAGAGLVLALAGAAAWRRWQGAVTGHSSSEDSTSIAGTSHAPDRVREPSARPDADSADATRLDTNETDDNRRGAGRTPTHGTTRAAEPAPTATPR